MFPAIDPSQLANIKRFVAESPQLQGKIALVREVISKPRNPEGLLRPTFQATLYGDREICVDISDILADNDEMVEVVTVTVIEFDGEDHQVLRMAHWPTSSEDAVLCAVYHVVTAIEQDGQNVMSELWVGSVDAEAATGPVVDFIDADQLDNSQVKFLD